MKGIEEMCRQGRLLLFCVSTFLRLNLPSLTFSSYTFTLIILSPDASPQHYPDFYATHTPRLIHLLIQLNIWILFTQSSHGF